MAYIESLSELKEYVLRQLGSPVINIEITDDHLNDAVDKALQKFIKEHYDGTDQGIVFLDIEKDVSDYFLIDNIISVKEIFPGTDFLAIDDEDWMMTTDKYSAYSGTDGNSEPFSIVDIEVWRQNARHWNLYFNGKTPFNFNQTTKKLSFPVVPKENTRYALNVYITEDEDNEYRLYDNDWLKEYCVALAGIQWSVNISKYDGVNLPGGGVINHATIETRYNEMKMRLDEELEEKYSEPIDPEFG